MSSKTCRCSRCHKDMMMPLDDAYCVEFVVQILQSIDAFQEFFETTAAGPKMSQLLCSLKIIKESLLKDGTVESEAFCEAFKFTEGLQEEIRNSLSAKQRKREGNKKSYRQRRR